MLEPTTIRIETIDDETHLFSMPISSEDGPDYSVGSKIERFLRQQSLALVADGELLVIPMHQIKSIHISPILHKLPETVVANVTRINQESKLMTTCDNESVFHRRESA